MAKGGHGLPKVSAGLTLPNLSAPYWQAMPETALWPFQGWLACKAGGLQPSFTILDTPRRTPMSVYIPDGFLRLLLQPNHHRIRRTGKMGRTSEQHSSAQLAMVNRLLAKPSLPYNFLQIC
jgi:hypothetical protein